MKAWRKVYESLPSSVEVPAEFAGERVEVILLVDLTSNGIEADSANGKNQGVTGTDEFGWPLGFLESTFGSLPELEEVSRPGPDAYEDRRDDE